MGSNNHNRQVSLLSLIAQADPSMYNAILQSIENEELQLDEYFKKKAIEIIKQRKNIDE